MTSGTKRRCLHWWVAFMLPGLMLRALIPVGFMPMVGPGHSIRIVVCDSYAPLPWMATGTAMSMPMDMPMDSMDMSEHRHPGDPAHSGKTPGHQDHDTCLYGSSPALGTLLALAIVPVSVQRSAELVVAAPQVAHADMSPRAQSARGPPA